MPVKESLRRALVQVRAVTEELLPAFQSPSDWTHQVVPGANHPLWFVGHMAVVDNFLIAVIDPSAVRQLGNFPKLFGSGSRPTNRPEDYPAAAEVLAAMRERRAKLLELLEGLSDEQLAQPTPAGTPPFLPVVASVFEMAPWHEGLHAGQMTVARRALGHAPVH
jgi:hypothetical protein